MRCRFSTYWTPARFRDSPDPISKRWPMALRDDYLGSFGSPSRHGLMCLWLAMHGTHEAISGLSAAIETRRFNDPDEARPFRLAWAAASRSPTEILGKEKTPGSPSEFTHRACGSRSRPMFGRSPPRIVFPA